MTWDHWAHPVVPCEDGFDGVCATEPELPRTLAEDFAFLQGVFDECPPITTTHEDGEVGGTGSISKCSFSSSSSCGSSDTISKTKFALAVLGRGVAVPCGIYCWMLVLLIDDLPTTAWLAYYLGGNVCILSVYARDVIIRAGHVPPRPWQSAVWALLSVCACVGVMAHTHDSEMTGSKRMMVHGLLQAIAYVSCIAMPSVLNLLRQLASGGNQIFEAFLLVLGMFLGALPLLVGGICTLLIYGLELRDPITLSALAWLWLIVQQVVLKTGRAIWKRAGKRHAVLSELAWCLYVETVFSSFSVHFFMHSVMSAISLACSIQFGVMLQILRGMHGYRCRCSRRCCSDVSVTERERAKLLLEVFAAFLCRLGAFALYLCRLTVLHFHKADVERPIQVFFDHSLLLDGTLSGDFVLCISCMALTSLLYLFSNLLLPLAWRAKSRVRRGEAHRAPGVDRVEHTKKRKPLVVRLRFKVQKAFLQQLYFFFVLNLFMAVALINMVNNISRMLLAWGTFQP